MPILVDARLLRTGPDLLRGTTVLRAQSPPFLGTPRCLSAAGHELFERHAGDK